MSADEPPQDVVQPEPEETPKPPTEPAAMATANKKRPRLDLDPQGNRERKRGKSMFGILLGTLNKAKIEDKERNASEAAKKRQLIDQRLQNKLRKETDSVRRAEEAKKSKTSANRKEEDLQLKDSVYKLRRRRLPQLANFLLTTDIIPSDDSSSPPPPKDPLSSPPRTHPPPLYYLPAILTPAQQTFVNRRKAEASEAAEKEWALFREERSVGITEIEQLRQRVAEEEARKRVERELEKDEIETEPTPAQKTTADDDSPMRGEDAPSQEVEMEIDDNSKTHEDSKDTAAEQEKKEEPTPMQADDDDAVEY